MCLRHGLDLKCTIFTDQGPMLAAAALFNENYQILLKLQLCLQHIICCICRLHPALFQTTTDNNRLSPAPGENKSKAIKSTGNQNDKTVLNMVHMASYATSCLEFFQIIYDCIPQLAIQSPVLRGDIMDVGIYLLELYSHLWALVKNSSNFSLEKYLLSLEPLYYEFLLTKHSFYCNPGESIDIEKMRRRVC